MPASERLSGLLSVRSWPSKTIEPTLPTMPVARPQAQAPKSKQRPYSAPAPVSRPAAPAAGGDNKEFDIPDFLKRSRI